METETNNALPETADVGEVAALIDKMDAADAAPVADQAPQQEDAAEAAEAPQEESAADDAAPEGDGEPASYEPPEFWSAEDKAKFAEMSPEHQAIALKYEQQRVEFVNKKAQEAAAERQKAQEEAKKALDTVAQAASWWEQNLPAMQQAFASKWQQVDWNKLAEENPAEWARLKQQAENEAGLLQQAHQRAQADMQLREQRAQQELVERKRAAHEEIARKMPDLFSGEKAAQTYDKVGKYLLAQGIPADRINAIHEAPIIELATKAMMFDEARKQASTVTQTRAADGKFTAKTAPTTVQPGPARRNTPGNQNAERARQVGERFRATGGKDMDLAAELIRLQGL